MCWILLTTETVKTFEDCRTVLRFYELRWRIEEFHKAWKTGAGVERQRMQSADNLERMAVILMFVAVRLIQIREALMLPYVRKQAESRPKRKCGMKKHQPIKWSVMMSGKCSG